MKRQLDLHGYTVHQAWDAYNRFITESYFDNEKAVTVITGHGMIGNEITAWTYNHSYARQCKRQDPNTGAYTVTLAKQPKKVVEQPPTNIVDLAKLARKYNRT